MGRVGTTATERGQVSRGFWGGMDGLCWQTRSGTEQRTVSTSPWVGRYFSVINQFWEHRGGVRVRGSWIQTWQCWICAASSLSPWRCAIDSENTDIAHFIILCRYYKKKMKKANWRFVATLLWVSSSAPFFQQHLLTSCLCYILVIFTIFQTLHQHKDYNSLKA